jgi:hypothetical protein
MGMQLYAVCGRVWNEEGGLRNDFTGRVRLDERKPPNGEQWCLYLGWLSWLGA